MRRLLGIFCFGAGLVCLALALSFAVEFYFRPDEISIILLVCLLPLVAGIGLLSFGRLEWEGRPPGTELHLPPLLRIFHRIKALPSRLISFGRSYREILAREPVQQTIFDSSKVPQRIPPVARYTPLDFLILQMLISLILVVTTLVWLVGTIVLFVGTFRDGFLSFFALGNFSLLFLAGFVPGVIGLPDLLWTWRNFNHPQLVLGLDASGLTVGRGYSRNEETRFLWTERVMLSKCLDTSRGVKGARIALDIRASEGRHVLIGDGEVTYQFNPVIADIRRFQEAYGSKSAQWRWPKG